MIKQEYQDSARLASCGVMLQLSALNAIQLVVLPKTTEVYAGMAMTVCALTLGATLFAYHFGKNWEQSKFILKLGVVLMALVLTVPFVLRNEPIAPATLWILGISVFFVLVSQWMGNGT